MRTLFRLLLAASLAPCLIAPATGGDAPPPLPAPVQGQAEPRLEPPRLSYAEVEKAARKLLAAYASGDGQKVYDSLSAPRRSGVALSMARLIARYEEKPERFERFKKKLPTTDPGDKLKIKTLDDLRMVSPADYFSLGTGMLRAAATEAVAKKLKEPWYMVEREIVMQQSRGPARESFMVTRGFALFENVGGDKITVFCMPDDDGWRVSNFDVKVGDFHAEFSGKIAGGTGPLFTEPVSAEARAALGAMKDRARVMYQRNRSAPATLNDLGLGARELAGSYFDNDCYSITKAEATEWVAICKPKDSDGPVMAICADLINGRSQFFEYEDTDAMEDNPPKLEAR